MKNTTIEEDLKDDGFEEFFNLIEYLIVTKKEFYTLVQLRTFFNQVAGGSLRSIDIKAMIRDHFKEKVIFCKPTVSSSKVSEYVISADSTVMPDTIHLVTTGNGINSCLQLKSIAQSISQDIQSYPVKDWPPTPQVIIESTEKVNKTLFNFIAWTVDPNSYNWLRKIISK